MCLGSELGYRFEPHGLFDPRAEPAMTVTPSQCGGGVPGVVLEVGYWEGGIPGTEPGPDPGQISQTWPGSEYNRFIRPFD